MRFEQAGKVFILNKETIKKHFANDKDLKNKAAVKKEF